MKRIVLCFTTVTVFLLITSGMMFSVYAKATLSDIAGHWAEGEIEAAIANGYINGYPDGTFQPERAITRAEFVKIINSAKKYAEYASIPFKDVPESKWYYTDVQKAYLVGFIKGDETGNFRPEANISRQEAAVIIGRLTQGGNPEFDISDISDSNTIAAWASSDVKKAFSLNYFSGDNKKMFNPTSALKRCEAVKIINRVLGLYVTTSLSKRPDSVLKVGDRYISQKLLDEFTVFMLCFYAMSQGMYIDSNQTEAMITEGKPNVLNMMAETEALRLHYKDKSNIIPDLTNDLASFKEQLYSDKTVAAIFAAYGVTDAAFIYYLETMYLHQYNREAASDFGAYPTDNDVLKYYTENPDYFKAPEKRRSSHILFEDRDHKSETKALAESVRNSIIKGEVTFEDMAKKYNTDSTKDTGGDLGFAGRGDFVPEFEDVLFSMKVGDISKIVETQFGYHIIKLTDIEEEGATGLDEVSISIRNYLLNMREDEYSKKILAATNVEYLSALYRPPN